MDSIKNYIEKNLSDKRRAHVYGVVETAVALAQKYGCDKKKAETAALFHDMFRSTPKEVLNMYVRQFNLDTVYMNNANLSHGPIAAAVMRSDYGIDDEDLLNAVRYHTTGREGMSLLEKILYIADAIEPGRNYPSVDELRKLAEISLDQACLASMERSIKYIRERGLFLHEDTIKARDYLLGKESNMECRDMAMLAAKAIDEKKGRDITIIDIGAKAAFADYMILASGGSDRQVSALCDAVEEKLDKEGVFVRNIEGKKGSGWILMDYGDIIINLLTEDLREKYNIEKVWADCEFLNLED